MKWNRWLSILGRLAILILSVGVLGWIWRQAEERRHAPTTSEWIGQAQSGSSDERRHAVSELGIAHAIDDVTVVPALIRALNDREASVRNEAALALWRYLAEALKVRGSATINHVRAAAMSLIEVVKRDRDNGVRASAAFAASSLLRELKDAGTEPDNSSADDPIDPRTLVKAFNAVLERDPAARLSLLVSYRRLGPIDEPAPPVLLATLDDPSRIVRIEALQAIAEFTSGVDQAVSVLLNEAESAPGEPQFNQSSHVYPLRQAAERLRPTAAVIPLLIKGLESPNPDVREVAVVLLGHLGPAARPATRALITATRSMIQAVKRAPELGEDPFFSDFASAVVRIAPADDAISVLSEALDPDHPTFGAHAAWFLGKLGPQGHAAVPILLKALKDAGDPPTGRILEEYAHAILRSLWDIAPGAALAEPMADEVVEVFSRSLDYPQSFIRRTAADALADFGPRAARALPRLRALSENGQAPREVREAAARAVQKIELEMEHDDV
jgi:HEAT repeat protein